MLYVKLSMTLRAYVALQVGSMASLASNVEDRSNSGAKVATEEMSKHMGPHSCISMLKVTVWLRHVKTSKSDYLNLCLRSTFLIEDIMVCVN